MLFRTKRRIQELEDDFGKLRRDFQALELEWTNVYDKLRKAMGRIVKSRAIVEAKEDERQEEAAEAQGQTGAVPSIHGLLTPRQKHIQQEILKRRAGG